MFPYLLMKPTKRGFIDITIFLTLSFIGEKFQIFKLSFPIYLNDIAYIVIFIGIGLHILAYRCNKQSHCKADAIKEIVTYGIYAKVRHPEYTGFILIYVGLFILFENVLSMLALILVSLILVLTALEEEKQLKRRFGRVYEEYAKKVKYRFIPYLI